jgi:hypothetical protein
MARGLVHAGSFDQSAAQDINDTSVFTGPIVKLTGLLDTINPHQSGNYVVTQAGAPDVMTLTAPTAGTDDGLMISVISDTTCAHTITATSLLANGTALKSLATFAAFRGAGVVLRAYNGVWQVISTMVCTLS